MLGFNILYPTDTSFYCWRILLFGLDKIGQSRQYKIQDLDPLDLQNRRFRSNRSGKFSWVKVELKKTSKFS